MPHKVAEYRQIIQRKGTTDSEVVEHFRHMVTHGWSMDEFKEEEDGTRHWIFVRYVEPEPPLNVFGLTVGEA